MSALEIVMVSVVSVLVFSIALYFIILKLFKKLTSDKANDFKILNQHARTEKIVFLGDSLTDFFPVNDFFPDVEIYNRGIAGDNTSDVMRRLDGITELKPQNFFIDRNQRFSPTQNSARRNGGTDNENCGSFVRHSEYLYHFWYPLNKTFLRFTWVFRNKANNAIIRKVNRLLEEKANALGYPFINVYDELIDENDNLKREYTLDGIHLSTKGYEQVVRKLKPYIYD